VTAAAIIAGAAILAPGWSYLPLDDPVWPWTQELEAAGLLRPAGVYPDEHLGADLPLSNLGSLSGPVGELAKRSSMPSEVILGGEGSELFAGGGIAAEGLYRGDGETRSGTWLSASGVLGGLLVFQERLSVWEGSDEEPPDGFPSCHMGRERGRHLYVDRGFLEGGGRGISVSVGRIPQRWGPGRFTSLLVSTNSPALDMIRFGWQPSEKLSFTGLTATVDSDSGIYLSAHRLDFWPSDRLRFGLSEAVLFSSRGLDLAYMNPVIPWYPVQWNERQDDNAFLCADFTAVPLDGFAGWGELLVDDLQYQKEYHRPDKLGLTVGAGYTSTSSTVGATLEYTRIDRFVYSQKLARNYYLHDGRIIGSELGPDGDRLTLALSTPALWPLAVEVRASHRRAGEGTVYEGYPDSVAVGPFPSGVVENTTDAAVRLFCVLPGGFEASASLDRWWKTNAGHVQGAEDRGTDASAEVRWNW